MSGHTTWFDLLPGFESAKHALGGPLGRTWTWQVFQSTYFELTHVTFAMLVVIFLVLGAVRYSAALAASADGGLVPPPRLSLRNAFEGLCDMVYSLIEGVLGAHDAKKYLPLLGSLFLFILVSNLISLIPGFRAPTDTLKTNLALSGLVFLSYHVLGIRAQGWSYLNQFTGHLPIKSPLVVFVPLMVLIEVISHLIRPASLSIRLMVNMFVDHALLLAFFALVPLVVPVPFLALGVLVSVVQAVVFTLLSSVYIAMATAHEDH